MKIAAIIGISNFARHHLLMVLEQALRGRVRLAAATVVNQGQERFFCDRLRTLGCRIYVDADAMWAEWAGRIDLCLIPTGIHVHPPMTLQALRAGANVLVEKPLATTLAGAEEVVRVERESGRFVAVGFQDLYTDSTWMIKRRILEGEIGRLRAIVFAGLWPRPAEYYARNAWAGRLRLDGRPVLDSPVSNAFAHFFNLALFWAAPALEAAAAVTDLQCELYRAQPIESFDTCCLRARLAGGLELCAYATHSSREERVPELRIHGSRGRIEWVQESHYDVVGRNGARLRHPVPGKFETKLMMADAVVARLDDPAARICGTRIAFEHARLVAMIHAAAPIIDVPAAHIRHERRPTGNWREIVDIEQAIDRAAEERRLWSEADDVPWARRVIALSRAATHRAAPVR